MDNLGKEGIKINKTTVYAVIIAVLITAVVFYIALKYIPDQKHNATVSEYKKALFDSVQCQYACPLSAQNVNNQTQMLPDNACVQSCTTTLQSKLATGDIISNKEITSDNLVTDIQGVINNCKTQSTTSNTNSTILAPTIDTAKFFACVKDALTTIKAKYSYLN